MKSLRYTGMDDEDLGIKFSYIDVKQAVLEFENKIKEIWRLRKNGDDQSPDSYIEYLENDFKTIFGDWEK